MTIAALRSLHAIIGDAIDDIERVYAAHGYSSTTTTTTTTAEDLNNIDQTSGKTTPEKQRSSDPDSGEAAVSTLQWEQEQERERAPHAPATTGRNRGAISTATPPTSQAYASPPPSPLSPLPVFDSERAHVSSLSVSASAGSVCDAHADLYVPPPPSTPTPTPTPTTTPTPQTHMETQTQTQTQTQAHTHTTPEPPTLDFPALDAPCNPASLAETLTAHPSVLAAICRIVAAAGQLGASVQTPFLTLCDATMGYHLPSCMRLLEASHVVEILREAGPDGLHVDKISAQNGVKASKLAHILRLLATHHILRERSPDVFALNRISSLVDSGKSVAQLKEYQDAGIPEMKYQDTNGVAAFVGLCTDEIQKASAYMTETYYLSASARTRAGAEPARAPFCFAFDTVRGGVGTGEGEGTGTGFFGWLEGDCAVGGEEGKQEGRRKEREKDMNDSDDGVERGRGGMFPPTLGPRLTLSESVREGWDSRSGRPHSIRASRAMAAGAPGEGGRRARGTKRYRTLPKSSGSGSGSGRSSTDLESKSHLTANVKTKMKTQSNASKKNKNKRTSANPNRFRLERFGKAMSGTDGWEAPGAALNGFDWSSLPHGSVVVDVGGGIGSTSMLLATAFSSASSAVGDSEEGSHDEAENDARTRGPRLKFIIQDRPVVCEMGEKAWKTKCPELLESTARFQVHDFFTPQPIHNAAVFLLRVVLHDWPDVFARKILLRLREAATRETKLVIADFVLPLACPDDVVVGADGGGGGDGMLDDIEGARTLPAPAPLLANLGKASANVYWMDLTMQTMFNSQERTLRELVSLALSAGWKIVKVTRTSGSLFGYLVAEPVDVPSQYQDVLSVDEKRRDDAPSSLQSSLPRSGHLDEEYTDFQNESKFERHLRERERERERERGEMEMEIIERASSRCGTPTFGSNTRLASVEEALARLGGGIMRAKAMSHAMSATSAGPSNSGSSGRLPSVPPLKPALSLFSTAKAKGNANTKVRVKKKPSPLSVPPLQSSPSPVGSPSRKMGFGVAPMLLASPAAVTASSTTQAQNQTTPPRRHLLSPSQSQSQSQSQSSPIPKVITRRMSLATLWSTNAHSQSQSQGPMQPQLLLPSPLSPSYAHTQEQTTPAAPKMHRRASYVHLSQTQGQADVGSVSPSSIPVRVSGESHFSASPGNRGGGDGGGFSLQRNLTASASASASATSASTSASSSVTGSPTPRTPRGPNPLPRRASNAHLLSSSTTALTQPGFHRKRSGTVVVGPSISLREGDAVHLNLRTRVGESGGDSRVKDVGASSVGKDIDDGDHRGMDSKFEDTRCMRSRQHGRHMSTSIIYEAQESLHPLLPQPQHDVVNVLAETARIEEKGLAGQPASYS